MLNDMKSEVHFQKGVMKFTFILLNTIPEELQKNTIATVEVNCIFKENCF